MWQERRCNHQRQIVAARNNKARDAAKGMPKHSSKALQKPAQHVSRPSKIEVGEGLGRQNSPKRRPRRGKRGPRASKKDPRAAKEAPKRVPRAAQERPRAGQEALGRCRNFSKILLGALQILICTRSWPNCLFEKLSGRFLFVFCVIRWMASMLRCAFRTTPASGL